MSQTISKLTYERDYHQWSIEQAKALRELVNTHQELKHLENVDWDNIIEEIEALGRSEYNAVVSLLIRQIEHRLKIDYVPLPECRNKWKSEVVAFKKNMKRKIAPSMKPKLQKEFSEIYQDAVEIVESEYEISLPSQCPYTLEDLLP
ncbi:DUF29 domain-containing protein [Crocosphaera sp. UHCC 0190]|uniref:DUF29 domain-containing protein n=1 Tax=unclassified Crocosphaera TaxID=2623705 RepID=UPI002B21FC9F|nr:MULTISPECIES: DUF29 domain-containing protein [unclassified Crocosphaera]MEA5511438.1 DUF29 domain-containing protein [Crocosphaera sp. UHCC 0190]MEA5535863.1 DUF29 domain-containing protein [Crocosphaera sp. XPORK-15E]